MNINTGFYYQQGVLVLEKNGPTGLREWASRLTWEQRTAMVHEYDEFVTAVREVASALSVGSTDPFEANTTHSVIDSQTVWRTPPRP